MAMIDMHAASDGVTRSAPHKLKSSFLSRCAGEPKIVVSWPPPGRFAALRLRYPAHYPYPTWFAMNFVDPVKATQGRFGRCYGVNPHKPARSLWRDD